jgi:DNA repair protein RadC
MKGPTRSIQRIRLKQVRDGRVKFKVEKVTRPMEVYQAVKAYYRGADREILSVLCLDTQSQPTAFNVVSVGTLNTTSTRPVDILKPAILSNSLAIILIHNHPSGTLNPSQDDIDFTRNVAKACEHMGLELHDHLIVTDSGFTSFRERGLL